jgi:hypothetical protein
LPQASTAIHVLVIVLPQLPKAVMSNPTCTTVAALQASLAVGAVNVGVPVHVTVTLAEVPITGGVLSVTDIVCDTVPLELPQASTALHVLVIVVAQPLPAVTSLPTCTTVAELQASLAVGAVNVGVPMHSTVAGAVAPITGGVLSPIEMVCDTVPLELPQASIAIHVLVIVLPQLPKAVISDPTCTTVAELQASLAVGAVNVGVPVHSTVAGAVVPITGGVLSPMEIV